jgi:hypothetical protein
VARAGGDISSEMKAKLKSENGVKANENGEEISKKKMKASKIK